MPVLMFHEVVPDNAGISPSDTVIYTSTFNAHMQALKNNGYTPVGISSLIQLMRGEVVYGGKPIVITFDDGWNNQLNAIPALNLQGFKATFNIIASLPGNDPSYMTWSSILNLSASGHEIADHSYSHTCKMSLSQAPTEIGTSKNILESKVGSTMQSFAWPCGYFTDSLTQYVKDIGFRGAQTIDENWCMKANQSLEGTSACQWKAGNTAGQDPYMIKRIFIDGHCSTAEFMQIVTQMHSMACTGASTLNATASTLSAPSNTLTTTDTTKLSTEPVAQNWRRPVVPRGAAVNNAPDSAFTRDPRDSVDPTNTGHADTALGDALARREKKQK